jgi:hypothetical protein
VSAPSVSVSLISQKGILPAVSGFADAFDRYIIITEIIDEKSDNDLFSDEERYKQLIRDEKLSENIKMKEEKETLNEKNEN